MFRYLFGSDNEDNDCIADHKLDELLCRLREMNAAIINLTESIQICIERRDAEILTKE